MADTANRPEPAGSGAAPSRSPADTAPPAPIAIRRMARRFVRLPNARRSLLLQAIAWLALARFALVFVPFRILAARFGTVASPAKNSAAKAAALEPEQSALAHDVGWAVTRAARYVPFRAVCLPQAIAAQVMLRRRNIGSVMHFGVAKKPGEDMAAHAWLSAAEIEVTGYPVAAEFVEVARFL